jgi:hypothetical protein
MWRDVDLVWTDVSEERISSIPEDGIPHSHRCENLKSDIHYFTRLIQDPTTLVRTLVTRLTRYALRNDMSDGRLLSGHLIQKVMRGQMMPTYWCKDSKQKWRRNLIRVSQARRTDT